MALERSWPTGITTSSTWLVPPTNMDDPNAPMKKLPIGTGSNGGGGLAGSSGLYRAMGLRPAIEAGSSALASR